MKSVLFIYPHQLFAAEFLPEVDHVYVIEEPLIFGTDEQYPCRFHKQKLVLHRASMRRYVEEVLWPKNLTVDYFDILDTPWTGQPILKAIDQGFERIVIFDVVDFTLSKRLSEVIADQGSKIKLDTHKTPGFYLQTNDIEQFFGSKKVYRFADFYQWQRERFNILIDDKFHPEGGKWSYESSGQEPLPANTQLPGMPSFGDNHYVKEAVEFVAEHFPNNPGNADAFIWPTSANEAQNWLEDFLQHRFLQSGSYQEAITNRGVWLFHSIISSSLNIGLLTPQLVVDAALAFANKNSIPLSSVENFVRQIIGWREYTRAIYVRDGVTLRNSNVFKNERHLTDHWYNATTNIKPLDDMINKLNDHAYAHHNERLMIAGNIMLLSEINPHDVFKWFMELFIDAYDWVVVPNVYGISQYSDGGTMIQKPFISASSYILNTSDYPRDEWCNVWDGLYWRFIDKHRTYLSRNPRVGGILVKRLDSMDDARRRIIGYRAEDFLNNFTKGS